MINDYAKYLFINSFDFDGLYNLHKNLNKRTENEKLLQELSDSIENILTKSDNFGDNFINIVKYFEMLNSDKCIEKIFYKIKIF